MDYLTDIAPYGSHKLHVTMEMDMNTNDIKLKIQFLSYNSHIFGAQCGVASGHSIAQSRCPMLAPSQKVLLARADKTSMIFSSILHSVFFCCCCCC